MLSGLNGREFQKPVNLIKKHCKEKGIEYAEIPFLYGGNYKKIKLDENKKSLIKEIFREWHASL